MRTFKKAVQLNIKIFFQYRWGFLLSVFMHPILLLISIMLFKAIYAYNQSNYIKGYDLTQMIWYFACVNFIWFFIWNFTDAHISERILSGEMTIDFLRPISIFRVELAHALALRVVGVSLEFTRDMIIYSLIFHPSFLTLVAFSKFIILAIGSFFLFFMINFLIGMCAFFIKNTQSLTSIKFIVFATLGGAYIPLEFLPEALHKVINILPFKYLFYEPIQFFLNRESTQGIPIFLKTICMQWVWFAILYLFYRIFWSVVVKRFCAVGG